MTDSDNFRQQVREWLQHNCPQSMRQPYRSEDDVCWGGRKWQFQSDAQRDWMHAMAQKGWTAPTWPEAYGGGGLTPPQAKILAQELKRIEARPALDHIFGLHMIGPALLKFGNEAQKAAHLPSIVRGEIRWCQGYSEPGAGSDLAGLQTRAEDCGDHFLVNGAKVWTSYADRADWIFCLVRTDTDSPKHQGISFLLFDMASEGVSTRPIRLISGNSPFCETYFEDVKVPKANLVGELNAGWTIAKYLLTHERTMIGGSALSPAGRKLLGLIAAENIGLADGKLTDPILRTDIARHEIDAASFGLTVQRVRDETKAGQGTGALSSLLKYYGTELNKDRNDLLMNICGDESLVWEDGDLKPSIPQDWLRSKGNSIEGGTSEIQLNIIAKRVLGLPG